MREIESSLLWLHCAFTLGGKTSAEHMVVSAASS